MYHTSTIDICLVHCSARDFEIHFSFLLDMSEIDFRSLVRIDVHKFFCSNIKQTIWKIWFLVYSVYLFNDYCHFCFRSCFSCFLCVFICFCFFNFSKKHLH
jgi:hypothetical protein